MKAQPMRPTKTNESNKPAEAPETRRRWGRYPTHGISVKVRYQDQEWDAFAMDESIGGLGLRTLEPTGLETGDVVELVYHGVAMPGNVSFVGTEKDGYYRVSVSWQEPKTNRSRELPFFRCGGVNVVCTFAPRRRARADKSSSGTASSSKSPKNNCVFSLATNDTPNY